MLKVFSELNPKSPIPTYLVAPVARFFSSEFFPLFSPFFPFRFQTLRARHVWPWSSLPLSRWLISLLDPDQDSPQLVLTPLLLLAGLNLPVLLDPWLLLTWPPSPVKMRHYAGVLSVGVGDSFAALVGSRYGGKLGSPKITKIWLKVSDSGT